MKYKLINDIINVVLPPDGIPVRNAKFWPSGESQDHIQSGPKVA